MARRQLVSGFDRAAQAAERSKRKCSKACAKIQSQEADCSCGAEAHNARVGQRAARFLRMGQAHAERQALRAKRSDERRQRREAMDKARAARRAAAAAKRRPAREADPQG